MSKASRSALLVAAALFGLFAAWRLAGQIRFDAALDRDDASAAAGLRPGAPDALLLLAERQLAAHEFDAASASARALLQASPTNGHAYRVLAQVAAQRKQDARASALYRIAARRAPRDLNARAWLAQHYLETGAYPEAVAQVDWVLRLSPASGGRIFPVLVDLAADAGFADALADGMRSRPSWRSGFLQVLRTSQQAGSDAATVDRLMGALQRTGGLDAPEFGDWIESLMAQGRWKDAHARWAAALPGGGRDLPRLYNGDFGSLPGGFGFDWRIREQPGVLLEIEPGTGSSGGALHARFLNRRVAGTMLEQPVLLPPGRYRLEWRERAEGLRGESGLQWQLGCNEPPHLLATGEAAVGSFGWRDRHLEFEIPPAGCTRQWLRWGTAGAAGAGQVITGESWVARVRINTRPSTY